MINVIYIFKCFESNQGFYTAYDYQ